MTRHWPYAAVALAAVTATLVWPLTSALPTPEAVQARVASAVAAALACALFASWRGLRRRAAVSVSVLSAVLGLVLLLKHFNALSACIADFEGRPVIIGTVYTVDVATYLRNNPGLSAADRLLDAGGAPERVWTMESVQACRLLVSWAGLAAIPFFAASAAALIPTGRYVLPARTSATPLPQAAAAVPLYDGFMSYRHLEPDRSIAFELVDLLEGRGFRLAIDARDFSPNEHFLAEMERCIKQSRFVLCVVTARFVQSDHTSEEAIISKTLDLAERRKRLVPLIFERVELPVWLHGLVGIDFTPSANVDPRERLAQLLVSHTNGGTART